MTEFDYYIGLDLGQVQDYTALVVLEAPCWVPTAPAFDSQALWPEGKAGWVSPSDLTPRQAQHMRAINYHGRPAKPPLSVTHIERFPLGTKYDPDIVDRVKQLMTTPPISLRSKVLLVDATGVGRAVVNTFEQAGLHPLAITITGGTSVSQEPDGLGYRVPQRELISATTVVVETRRLSIAESLPEASTLVRELLGFQRRINPHTAHDSYAAWREGQHDDLVFSLALCCWFREWWNHHFDLANEAAPASHR